jgi:hypothetical protein
MHGPLLLHAWCFDDGEEGEQMSTTPHILVIFGSTRQARRGEAVANWLMDRLAQRTHATFE